MTTGALLEIVGLEKPDSLRRPHQRRTEDGTEGDRQHLPGLDQRANREQVLCCDVQASLRELRQCQVWPLVVIGAELSTKKRGEQRRTMPDLDLIERLADAPLSFCLVDCHPHSLGQHGHQVPVSPNGSLMCVSRVASVCRVPYACPRRVQPTAVVRGEQGFELLVEGCFQAPKHSLLGLIGEHVPTLVDVEPLKEHKRLGLGQGHDHGLRAILRVSHS